MNPKHKEIKKRIDERELDINGMESFFSALLKGFLSDISDKIVIRGETVPHIVMNTGDDTMFIAYKGHDQSLEPLENTNEDYIYNKIPRAVVTFSSLTLLTDQLTAPNTRGTFNLECDGELYGCSAEFRRMPVQTTVSVKYIFDSFEDSLMCSQQIITNLAFINNFTITYMGQTVNSTYTVPDSVETESTIEFEGLTTETKNRIISIDYLLETNLPVFNRRTVIMSSEMIANPVARITIPIPEKEEQI